MKKLKLTKITVSNLTDEQMDRIYGASINYTSCFCNNTESCSINYGCCPPPEKLAQLDNDPE